MTNLKKVIAAAEEKFGDVIAIQPRRFVSFQGEPDMEEFRLACKRSHPAIPDRPWMTITGSIKQNGNEQVIDFYWGHYDLTPVRMQEIMKEV